MPLICDFSFISYLCDCEASSEIFFKFYFTFSFLSQLEEFRKKKAADRAKKTASVGQPQSADIISYIQTFEKEKVRGMDLDGAGISDGVGGAVTKVLSNDDKKIEIIQNGEPCSSDIYVKPPFLYRIL